uniref:Auxin response factor n=1 Tax=Kalanchoe fedtschenkoi TaxID=63787 RepID=A0A7N0RCA3_KALFE
MERSLDSQLWHACAGGMVQMPKVNSKVYYFPQGHAEHAQAGLDFALSPKAGPLVPCRVASVQFLADPETDEVYAKLRLVPVGNRELEFGVEDLGVCRGSESVDKPSSFAKTLTQSDANNGGGFSVPRYCAETIFPRLDYTADPPVQTVIAKDVHGEIWKFRHIYRGTPRRHLLTTGWSTFVNQKKLVAGDSIVFLRTGSGELCVGIRRAKRGMESESGSGIRSQSGWSPSPGHFISPYGGGGYSMFLRDDENGFLRNGCGEGGLKTNKKVKGESVIEAATLATNGRPFEVVYYPRACTPEFCVAASAVRAAMRIQWCPGMRFKMPFETEDSSRISWFMGTVSSVQVADPLRWPNSPWRLLQVTWDEPDLLQNVNRVSPWLVELVSNTPAMNLPPFSSPRKKLRFPPQPDFPLDGQLSLSSFSGNNLGPRSSFCCLIDNTPPGIQGARHAQFGSSLSDIHFNSKLRSWLFPQSQQRLDQFPRLFNNIISSSAKGNESESVSCLLSIGNSDHNVEKPKDGKKQPFVLFGQPILTEQEISLRSESTLQALARNHSSDDHLERGKVHTSGLELRRSLSDTSSHPGFSRLFNFASDELSMASGRCEVFMDNDGVGRTLDLSPIQSYQQLCLKLADLFGIGNPNALNHALYRDATGAIKRIGDEPFSDFRKSAKKLIITVDLGKKNNGREQYLSGPGKAENGLCSSKAAAGHLSILA